MIGGHWSKEEHKIVDSDATELYSPMPVIWFKPADYYTPDSDHYQCPLYITSNRGGVISTSGASANFITSIEIPVSDEPQQWTLRGCALVCQPT